MALSRIVFRIGIVVFLANKLLLLNATAQEVPDRGPVPFAVYDVDGDGLITEQEFTAVREQRMAKRSVEGKPMRGMASAPAFSDFDTNSDGSLTSEELLGGQRRQMEKRGSMGMGQGRGKGQGAGRNMPAFSDYDLDGDGKIGEEEFNEARSKRIREMTQQGYQMKNLGNAPSFPDMDTDGDGHIDADEFTLHQDQRRQQRNK